MSDAVCVVGFGFPFLVRARLVVHGAGARTPDLCVWGHSLIPTHALVRSRICEDSILYLTVEPLACVIVFINKIVPKKTMIKKIKTNEIERAIVENDLYKELGVRPVINARGTWTYLGGVLIRAKVKQAMNRASLHSVEVLELQRAVGKRLAKITGAEAAMVTSGAAAAIAAGTAACMSGTDPNKVYQLPDTTDMKNEVILTRRSVWDSAIRLTGAKLVLADTIDDIRSSINSKTAMVYWRVQEKYSVEEILPLCRKVGVPLFLDSASSIPCKDPIGVLKTQAKMGVDLYTISGGKGLGGSQSSAVLIGRSDLIEAALANYCPWEGSICRPMKVGKEDIVGALVAVETYMKRDHKKDWLSWEKKAQRIVNAVNQISQVRAYVGIPKGNYPVPHCIIEWEEKLCGFNVVQCVKSLKDGEPSIVVHSTDNPSLVRAQILLEQEKSSAIPNMTESKAWIAICPIMLKTKHEAIIVKRIKEIFK